MNKRRKKRKGYKQATGFQKLMALASVAVAGFLLFVSGTATYKVVGKFLAEAGEFDPTLGFFGVALLAGSVISVLAPKHRRNAFVTAGFLAVNAALNGAFLADRLFSSGWEENRVAAMAAKQVELAGVFREQAKVRANAAEAAKEGLKFETTGKDGAQRASLYGPKAQSHAARLEQALADQSASLAEEAALAKQSLLLLSEQGEKQAQLSPVVQVIRNSVPEQYRPYAWVLLILGFVLAMDPLALWLLSGARNVLFPEDQLVGGRGLSHQDKTRLLLKALENLSD